MSLSQLPDRAVQSFDAELAGRVRTYLVECRQEFRRLSIWAEQGTVRLSGRVNSFYRRQLALATAQRVDGVVRVVDDMQVPLRPLPDQD